MPHTAIPNARLTTDEPFDTTLATDLANNDAWLKSDATNGGSGIEPTVDAFNTAFTAHSHDGTDGQGATIPAGGIATSGINDPDEIASGAVTTAKLATGASGVGTDNFDDGAVTPAKLSGRLGTNFTGSQAYASGNKTISHGLGRRPVVCSMNDINFEIISTSASSVVLGRSKYSALDPWTYDFDAV